MADEVATVSSSPAFGFAAVVVVMRFRSYSGPASRCRHGWLVDETDHKAQHEPIDETGGRQAPRQPSPDVQHDVMYDGDVADHQDADGGAKSHAFLHAAPALVPFRVHVGRGEHRDEDPQEQKRHVGHVLRGPVHTWVLTELTPQQHPIHEEPIGHVDDGADHGGGSKAAVIHRTLLFLIAWGPTFLIRV